MPQDVVAEEKLTWLAGAEVVVPTTGGRGCVRGISGAAEADSESLKAAYGEVAAEAKEVLAESQVRSVCPDGFQATREAWRRLFPTITLVLCSLHASLKLKERCRGALRRQVLDRAGHVYQATTTGQFAQRVRRLSEWASATLDGTVAEMVSKLCRHRTDFTPAYECPQAARTTNAVDRLHNQLDRVLDAMRYCHGQPASARLAVRAWARQWNFHPYSVRLAMPSQRARLLSTISTASTITPTGCRTS
jgi:transposase-like protein